MQTLEESVESREWDASPERSSEAGGVVKPCDLQVYYREAGMDYEAWSPGFHMHFGWWRRGLNPFDRERMLVEMSQKVLDRVLPGGGAAGRLLDLGCGLGATTRLAAKRFPEAEVTGVTLVPWQVAKARELTELSAASSSEVTPNFEVADFLRLDLPSSSVDGAWAIESSCHPPGLSKRTFVREAARILKPGARLVVADGFLKRGRPRNPLLRRLFDLTCHNWALETFADLNAFRSAMHDAGFSYIQVREISWRIAPSALHVPWVTLRFLLGDVLRNPRAMTRARWGHLLACFLAPLVGLARRDFGYYLITATK